MINATDAPGNTCSQNVWRPKTHGDKNAKLLKYFRQMNFFPCFPVTKRFRPRRFICIQCNLCYKFSRNNLANPNGRKVVNYRGGKPSRDREYFRRNWTFHFFARDFRKEMIWREMFSGASNHEGLSLLESISCSLDQNVICSWKTNVYVLYQLDCYNISIASKRSTRLTRRCLASNSKYFLQ